MVNTLGYLHLLGSREMMVATKTALEIEKIQSIDILKGLQEGWNVLLGQNQTQTAELTYEWQVSYWNYFHEDSEPFVLVVKEAGSIIGIAPFRLTHKRRLGVRIRYLEFMAARESNYQDFILGHRSEEALECIVNYLRNHSHEWDVLSFWHLPESSTTGHFVLDRFHHGFIPRIASVEKCIFTKIDKTWEEYASASKSARSKVAYRLRKLQKHGAVNAYHCVDEGQFRKNLSIFFDLHRQRWNKTDTPSQFNDDRYCEFYLDAGLQLLAKRQIDLFVLEVGGRPVAMLLAFLFNRVYLQQLTAFEESYSQASPSLVMHELFVQELFEGEIELFDFGHYYPYKEMWASCFKNRLNITIHRRSIAGYYDYFVTRLATAIRTEIKRNTLLTKVAKGIRRRVGFLAALDDKNLATGHPQE